MWKLKILQNSVPLSLKNMVTRLELHCIQNYTCINITLKKDVWQNYKVRVLICGGKKKKVMLTRNCKFAIFDSPNFQ